MCGRAKAAKNRNGYPAAPRVAILSCISARFSAPVLLFGGVRGNGDFLCPASSNGRLITDQSPNSTGPELATWLLRRLRRDYGRWWLCLFEIKTDKLGLNRAGLDNYDLLLRIYDALLVHLVPQRGDQRSTPVWVHAPVLHHKYSLHNYLRKLRTYSFCFTNSIRIV